MSSAPSAVRHQQEGMALSEFAALHGLTVGQVRRAARGGKIMGAQRHSVSGHWFVYPPAKLMVSIRPYGVTPGEHKSASDSLQAGDHRAHGVAIGGKSATALAVASQPSRGLPDAKEFLGHAADGGLEWSSGVQAARKAEEAGYVGFAFGTSPHGLAADSHRPFPKDSGSVSASPLADQQAEGAQAFDVGFDSDGFDSGGEGSEPPAACEDGEPDESDFDLAFVNQKMPEVFRTPEVRSAGRCIKAALLKCDPHVHRFALDDCEFLHLFRAVEHCRSRMRKTIGKGLDKVGSLRATDSLWQKLQAEMQRCHQRRPA